MNGCIEESDLKTIADSMITDFDRDVAAVPEDQCAPFHALAQNLQGNLLTVYRMVAMLAKHQEDLAKVATLWGCVVFMCDEFAKKLGELKTAHPYCGAESYYDRVLDLRNKCLRLQKMHS